MPGWWLTIGSLNVNISALCVLFFNTNVPYIKRQSGCGGLLCSSPRANRLQQAANGVRALYSRASTNRENSRLAYFLLVVWKTGGRIITGVKTPYSRTKQTQGRNCFVCRAVLCAALQQQYHRPHTYTYYSRSRYSNSR